MPCHAAPTAVCGFAARGKHLGPQHHGLQAGRQATAPRSFELNRRRAAPNAAWRSTGTEVGPVHLMLSMYIDIKSQMPAGRWLAIRQAGTCSHAQARTHICTPRTPPPCMLQHPTPPVPPQQKARTRGRWQPAAGTTQRPGMLAVKAWEGPLVQSPARDGAPAAAALKCDGGRRRRQTARRGIRSGSMTSGLLGPDPTSHDHSLPDAGPGGSGAAITRLLAALRGTAEMRHGGHTTCVTRPSRSPRCTCRPTRCGAAGAAAGVGPEGEDSRAVAPSTTVRPEHTEELSWPRRHCSVAKGWGGCRRSTKASYPPPKPTR